MEEIMNHLRVVQKFKDGKDRKGTNIFAINNKLYSYGRHFTLAVRREGESNKQTGKEWFLLNGDKNSVSTSRHQDLTYRVFNEFPRVAFSAIHAAGLSENRCNLIDFRNDENGWAVKGHGNKDFEDFKSHIPFGAEYHEHKRGGIIYAKSFHKIGGCLLEENGKYYICGMDEGSYFVSLLPRKAVSIESAYKLLKPAAVQKAEKAGIPVIRQGEWFFFPADIQIKEIYFQKSGVLPKDSAESSSHICTRLTNIKGKLYAKGIVRHKNRWNGRGDHRPLKLGDRKTIYQAFRNTALNSWSANGRVD
jgi:hypothetical protein